MVPSSIASTRTLLDSHGADFSHRAPQALVLVAMHQDIPSLSREVDEAAIPKLSTHVNLFPVAGLELIFCDIILQLT